MIITNEFGVSLPVAVWLLHDEYDYVKDPKYLSATTLLKPIKQIVMHKRVDWANETMDVMDKVKSSMGTAIHDSIERVWRNENARNYALAMLGIPQKAIKAVRINPTPEELAADDTIIPVYLEQRGTKVVDGWTIGGKFDLVIEGMLQDYKSTSTFVWLYGTRDDEHKMQGSVYRFLHDSIITEDFIRINYLFTDWRAGDTSNPKYPQQPCMHKDIPLLSYVETEQWIRAKLRLIEKYWDAPESEIPDCTDEELWRSETTFKYYADPSKTTGRSTKNFTGATAHIDARKFMAEKGGKGVIIPVVGEPKRCNYCSVYSVCKQKDRYFQ